MYLAMCFCFQQQLVDSIVWWWFLWKLKQLLHQAIYIISSWVWFFFNWLSIIMEKLFAFLLLQRSPVILCTFNAGRRRGLRHLHQSHVSSLFPWSALDILWPRTPLQPEHPSEATSCNSDVCVCGRHRRRLHRACLHMRLHRRRHTRRQCSRRVDSTVWPGRVRSCRFPFLLLITGASSSDI